MLPLPDRRGGEEATPAVCVPGVSAGRRNGRPLLPCQTAWVLHRGPPPACPVPPQRVKQTAPPQDPHLPSPPCCGPVVVWTLCC